MAQAPSPTYIVLDNPSWLGKPRAAQTVLQGLREWDFDPNETHDGICMLQALLGNVSGLNLKEELLVEAVQVLLERGANPEGAFAPGHATIQWQRFPAVKHLLTQAIHPDDQHQADPRSAKIWGYLRSSETADQIGARVGMALGPQGFQERIEGLNAGAWVALNASTVGEALQGWCVPHQHYGGEQGRITRVARKAVVEGKLLQVGTPEERVIAAWGLAAGVGNFNGNNDDRAARDAAVNTCNKLLQGVDGHRLLVELSQSTLLTREQKSRLGGAMLLAGSLMQSKTDPWDLMVDAWPLLEDPRLDITRCSQPLVRQHAFPTAQLDRIAPTAPNQQILMDILAASLDRFADNGPAQQQERFEFIEALGRWRQGHDLPKPDRKRLLQKIGVQDADIMRGIPEALDAMVLQGATTGPQASVRHSPRL